jgi:hypothetical protein
MITAQRTVNGPVPPPPCSAANIDPLLNEDYAKALTPAPELPRCRFLSSDKRQCRMLRADHHPDFCLFHAARQDEIFALLPEREFSLAPELEALAADLTTATGVNRALGQVFRLLAKNHITRKDAVAFGYIAQLLLQTVPGVRAEAVSAFGHKAWASQLKSSLTPQPADPASPPRKGDQQDALLAGNKVTPSESAVADESNGATGAAAPAPDATPLTLSSRASSEGSLSATPIPEKPSPRETTSANPAEPAVAANASATSAFSRPNSTIRPGSSSRATNGSEGTLPDAQAPPDYESLLNRSVDLLDGKFDASPESQREARRLLRDLEQITPPCVSAVECALPQTQPQPAQNVYLQNEHPDRMFVPSEQREPRDLSGACVAQLPQNVHLQNHST